MLSLEQCRQVLGAATPEDESELRRIRDDLSELSQLFIALLTQGDSRTWTDSSRSSSSADASRCPRPVPAFELLCSSLGEDKAYELVERAAILEFDGGVESHEAELTAMREWLSKTEH